MAMACFRLVTFLPLRPLFSLPRFISRISVSTFSPADGEYFLSDDFFLLDGFLAALFVLLELFFADFFFAGILLSSELLDGRAFCASCIPGCAPSGNPPLWFPCAQPKENSAPCRGIYLDSTIGTKAEGNLATHAPAIPALRLLAQTLETVFVFAGRRHHRGARYHLRTGVNWRLLNR